MRSISRMTTRSAHLSFIALAPLVRAGQGAAGGKAVCGPAAWIAATRGQSPSQWRFIGGFLAALE
jgi:hypothetical protein